MPVTYQSDGGTVFAAANSNAAITVTLPATRPAGSVLLCLIFCRLITASVTTAPSGYTLLSTWTSGTASGGRMWLYAKIAGASETAPTVATDGATGTTGDLWGACLFCYDGVDTSGGISAIYDGTPVTTDAAGTTTCTFAALTIAGTASMILRFLARWEDAATTFTQTATWNEREDANSTNRTGGQCFLQDKAATASGSQASVTVAPSATGSIRYLSVTAALKEAPLVKPKRYFSRSNQASVMRAATR